MKFINRIELKLENFEKCFIVCDQDCQWGNIYDFATGIKTFAAQKIQEAEETKLQEKQENKE